MSHISKVSISIRRKKGKGLPGDDITLHNIKIGSSLSAKGGGVLRGLNFEEEKELLPELINASPTDNEWRRRTQDYWNNISVVVPADGSTVDKLQGKNLNFTVEFKTATDKKEFDNLLDFEDKVKVIQKTKAQIVEGISSYVLFRYCLVYSRVANKVEWVNRSPKIHFYLYSKQTQTKIEHTALKRRTKALAEFIKILPEEGKVNAVLLLFNQNVSLYESIEDKHLALEGLVKSQPLKFLSFIEDDNLAIKALILKAVDKGVIHNPPNTSTYYYGGNNEHTLGTTLDNTVLFLKSEEDTNKQLFEAIKTQVKNA